MKEIINLINENKWFFKWFLGIGSAVSLILIVIVALPGGKVKIGPVEFHGNSSPNNTKSTDSETESTKPRTNNSIDSCATIEIVEPLDKAIVDQTITIKGNIIKIGKEDCDYYLNVLSGRIRTFSKPIHISSAKSWSISNVRIGDRNSTGKEFTLQFIDGNKCEKFKGEDIVTCEETNVLDEIYVERK